jgi:ABC-type spermidine/putrescine transport system permease subunit I
MPIAKTMTHADLAPGFKLPRWRLGPIILVVPALACIGAVSVYPVLLGLWLSLRNTTLSSPEDAFIGFANYQQLFADGAFWNAWIHTIEFMGASTLLETAIGLGMALVMSERFLGRGIVRAAVLIPWAIPTVVTSKMFGWLFDGQHGIVNYLLRSCGLVGGNLNWYGSPELALPTIIIADVWKTTPFMALLLVRFVLLLRGTNSCSPWRSPRTLIVKLCRSASLTLPTCTTSLGGTSRPRQWLLPCRWSRWSWASSNTLSQG